MTTAFKHDTDALSVMDWFCGAGGSSQGAHAVPGVRVTRAANHCAPVAYRWMSWPVMASTSAQRITSAAFGVVAA